MMVRPKRRFKKALDLTFEKERYKLSVGKKNISKEEKKKKKKNLLSTIEEIVKELDFDTITTIVMEGNKDAKS